MNIDFYKKILTSTHEYWVVAKKNNYYECGKLKRRKDQILFICIPKEIKRDLKESAILLDDVEKMEDCHIKKNIFLSENFPPFQLGISFYNIYKGFAVTEKYNKFLVEALQLKSHKLFEYKRLMEKLQEQE